MSRRNVPRPTYIDGDIRGKKIWSDEEDKQLRELVEQYGTGNWTSISAILVGRTGKQCRERWHNHLDPIVRKGEWTEEEDKIIVTLQKCYGNQWSKITKMLPGRTDNAVKNRWHATMRSKKGNGSLYDETLLTAHRLEYVVDDAVPFVETDQKAFEIFDDSSNKSLEKSSFSTKKSNLLLLEEPPLPLQDPQKIFSILSNTMLAVPKIEVISRPQSASPIEHRMSDEDSINSLENWIGFDPSSVQGLPSLGNCFDVELNSDSFRWAADANEMDTFEPDDQTMEDSDFVSEVSPMQQSQSSVQEMAYGHESFPQLSSLNTFRSDQSIYEYSEYSNGHMVGPLSNSVSSSAPQSSPQSSCNNVEKDTKRKYGVFPMSNCSAFSMTSAASFCGLKCKEK